jgi:hypothetical protein
MNDGSFCTVPVIRCSIWASRDEVPGTVSQKVDTEKSLLSLLWPVNGIHDLLDLPKDNTYNSAFFCDTVIPSLFK